MIFAEINGIPRFVASDSLTPEQIKAFFSKLKVKRSKEGSQSKSSSNSVQPTSIDLLVNDINHYVDNTKTNDLDNEISIDTNDYHEQQISNEEIDDLDSLMEITQLHHLQTIAIETLRSSDNQLY